jgi:hypothetical protein
MYLLVEINFFEKLFQIFCSCFKTLIIFCFVGVLRYILVYKSFVGYIHIADNFSQLRACLFSLVPSSLPSSFPASPLLIFPPFPPLYLYNLAQAEKMHHKSNKQSQFPAPLEPHMSTDILLGHLS